MLSSIHPLGERARHNRWGLTVTSFTLASTLAAAAVGAALGWIGSLLVGEVDPVLLLISTAALALTAGALDLARVRPPGPERQVNEAWIGHYRGWVYGGTFGAQLGTGLVTFVVTWGVFATLGSELLSASPVTGALIGAVFGFGRSLALLLAGRIDRPTRLTTFHRRMADLGPWVRKGTGAALAASGVIATLGGWL